MNGSFTTILSVFLLFGLLASTSPLPGINHHPLPGPRCFKVLVKTPGNATLDGKHYIDIKDGVVGFDRGGDDFVAHINGTEQGNSYLITRGHGYGFLLEDEAPRYDFKINFNIPPTDFKAYWAVRDGVLTCHLLTDGFKVFPDPNGGYIIRWDTRDETGAPLLMQVEWCRN